jgi:hypothetical protein
MTWNGESSARANRLTRCLSGCGVVLLCWSLAGCHRESGPIGVLVNELGVSKTPIGPASRDVASTGFLAPDSLLRVRSGDVVGDQTVDTIVETDTHRSVEVRDGNDATVTTIPAAAYVSDFIPLIDPSAPKQSVLLYLYPDEQGGATFSVVKVTGLQPVATWREDTGGGGHVATGSWGGGAAVFYLQNGAIVVRGIGGDLLTRITVSGLQEFSYVYASTLAEGRTVFVVSGNGYTQYHMVVIVDRDGRVQYQARDSEQAFRLAVGAEASQFDVETRSTVWRYALGQRK